MYKYIIFNVVPIFSCLYLYNCSIVRFTKHRILFLKLLEILKIN